MIVLVTGSTGFIGGALCRELTAQGYRVRAFHRPTSALTVLDGLPVEHIIGDLTQPESLVRAMQGVEVVFHAAAMMAESASPGRFYTVTVEGTRSVLISAQKAGVRRVVHTSSVAALGVPESGAHNLASLLNENHSWNYPPDHWPYGYAKYLAEMEVQQAVSNGLDVVIVNPSIVFGGGDVYRKASSLVVQIARQRLPVMVEGGANFVHIQDVVDGHMAALKAGVRGQRYILGGHNLSFRAVSAQIAAVVGAKVPGLVIPSGIVHLAAGPARWFKTLIDFPFGVELLSLAGKYFYYDLTKAQRELGLPAPRPLEQAVAEAHQWFLQMGAVPRSARQ